MVTVALELEYKKEGKYKYLATRRNHVPLFWVEFPSNNQAPKTVTKYLYMRITSCSLNFSASYSSYTQHACKPIDNSQEDINIVIFLYAAPLLPIISYFITFQDHHKKCCPR